MRFVKVYDEDHESEIVGRFVDLDQVVRIKCTVFKNTDASLKRIVNNDLASKMEDRNVNVRLFTANGDEEVWFSDVVKAARWLNEHFGLINVFSAR